MSCFCLTPYPLPVQAEPRLLGLLASRSAVAPLLAPLRTAATAAAAATALATHAYANTAASTFATAAAAATDTASQDGSTTASPQQPGTQTPTIPHPATRPALHTAAQPTAHTPHTSVTAPTIFQAASSAAPLAEASLSLLRRLVSHAGCVTALASTPAAAHAVSQLLYAPPSLEALVAALRLLHALAGE